MIQQSQLCLAKPHHLVESLVLLDGRFPRTAVLRSSCGVKIENVLADVAIGDGSVFRAVSVMCTFCVGGSCTQQEMKKRMCAAAVAELPCLQDSNSAATRVSRIPHALWKRSSRSCTNLKPVWSRPWAPSHGPVLSLANKSVPRRLVALSCNAVLPVDWTASPMCTIMALIVSSKEKIRVASCASTCTRCTLQVDSSSTFKACLQLCYQRQQQGRRRKRRIMFSSLSSVSRRCMITLFSAKLASYLCMGWRL